MKTLRRPETWVLLILLASYAFFWHGRDWNVASRLMLTYALVDRGTLTIDGLENQTGDLARYRDHYYSDKTPGFSLLAVLPYAVVKTVFRLPDHPLGRPGFAYWPADYGITLGTSGLLSAFSAVILVGLARDLGCGPRRSALVGLSYGLATPAFAYATLAYGHQVAAFALLASFGLLWRDQPRPCSRAAMAGFLASFAAVVEIQVGPVSAILGLYLVAMVMGKQRPPLTLLSFGLGAAVPSLILLAYNSLAFGSPWRMGYFYEVLDRFQAVHSSRNPLGMRRPDWSKLGPLLWGEKRGLIRFAPIVSLTIPGMIALLVRRFWGAAVVVGATIAVVILVNLSYPEWTGGWSTGPRLLVPLLPFAMIPVAGLLAIGGRSATVSAIGLAVVGGLVIFSFQAIGARVPDFVDRPLVEGVWPLLQGARPLPGWVYGHRYARNLVSLAFPDAVQKLPVWAGWVQFLPLLIYQIGMIGWMLRMVKERPPVPEKFVPQTF